MSKFVKAVKKGEIAEGSGKICEIEGKAIAVFNVGGKFYALDNTCRHQGGPLGEGFLDGKEVTCPWHAWVYNIETGACLSESDVKLATYPLKIEGDDILVEV